MGNDAVFSAVHLFSQPKVVGAIMGKVTGLLLEQDLNEILPLIRGDVSEMAGLPESFTS